ncbi:hypothetical protein [Nocardia sp. CA-135398]|uniref:hypothetical protein n=1 Tax=Nocardia sp. CA-135398 TaxID=3239977 RepID=UPI003D98ED6C
MSDLYVDQAALEGMVAVLNTAHDALAAVKATSFMWAIENALPGSGLGHAFMKAGARAELSVRGVNVQLKEINDSAGICIAEYNRQQQEQAQRIAELSESLESGPR